MEIPMAEQSQGFWSTLPGILTGIAAVITAATGLYIAISNNNKHDLQSDKVIEIDSGTKEPLDKTLAPIPKAEDKELIINQDVAPKTIAVKNLPPFPITGSLVDCSLFPTVNTIASLMSWSNHYHKQVIAADGVKIRALEPCNKTIDYRGMAHCQAPDNPKIRQAFLETLQLCRKAGIEWQNIQHSSILGQ